MVALETQTEALIEEILESLRNCRFAHLLSEGSKIENVSNLLETMRKYLSGQHAIARDGVTTDGGSAPPQPQQLAKCLTQSLEIVETVKKVKATVMEEIRRVTVEGEKEEAERTRLQTEEEERKKAEEAADAAAEAEKKEEEEKKQAAAAAAAEQQKSTAPAVASAPVDGSGAPATSTSAFYTLTQSKLAEFEGLYSGLASDKESKKIKFELQKAINTLVNSLANDPTEHRHRGMGTVAPPDIRHRLLILR